MLGYPNNITKFFSWQSFVTLLLCCRTFIRFIFIFIFIFVVNIARPSCWHRTHTRTSISESAFSTMLQTKSDLGMMRQLLRPPKLYFGGQLFVWKPGKVSSLLQFSAVTLVNRPGGERLFVALFYFTNWCEFPAKKAALYHHTCYTLVSGCSIVFPVSPC